MSKRRRGGLLYPGFVWVSKKLNRWISRHRSFARYEWFHGQIKYSHSEWKEIDKNKYELYPQVHIGSQIITVRVRFTHFPEGGPDYHKDYVEVWGAHIIRSKKRRR